jgi:hypothetical protein
MYCSGALLPVKPRQMVGKLVLVIRVSSEGGAEGVAPSVVLRAGFFPVYLIRCNTSIFMEGIE